MVNTVKTDLRVLRLLLFILCSAGHVLCVEEFKVVGGNVSFTPKITGKPESILWKFNNDKVVEFEDGSEKWFQFKGALDRNTGVLTLKELKKGNTGQYEAEILINSNLETTKFRLQVIDAVGVPTISCKVAGDGQITLMCSVHNSLEPLEYVWSGPGGQNKGKNLTVSKETNQESVYFCTVSNKVSEKSATDFTLKACYGPDHHPVPVVTIVLSVLGSLVAILAILAVAFREKIKEKIASKR